MPTKRFLNLPSEKRERVIQAAIYEFSGKGIDETDIAAVVKRAGIPRGSFYQYFSDKDDLIIYAIEKIKVEKLKYCKDGVNIRGKVSFIDYYYNLFIRALEFAQKNPEYLSIGASLVVSKSKRIQQYISENKQKLCQYYKSLIENEKKLGLIRKDVSSESITHMIMNMTSDSVVKLVYEGQQNMSDIKKVFEEIFKIIKQGLDPHGDII